MSRGSRIALTVVAVAVVAGAAAPFILGRSAGAETPAYLSETVSSTDVTQSVVASGTVRDRYTFSIAPDLDPVLIDMAGTTIATSAAARGYVTTDLRVAAGDRVERGDILALVEDPDGDEVKVKAPFDGTVRSVLTAERSDAASIVTLGVGTRVAALSVSEFDVASLSVGQAATLTVNATGDEAKAEVSTVATTATSDSGVQSFQALLSVARWPAKTRVGMSVTATVTVAQRADVLSVSTAAITMQGERATVKIVGKDGVTTSRPVTLGLVGDSRVEITDGLALGDVVVTGASGPVPTTDSGGFLPPRPPGGGAP